MKTRNRAGGLGLSSSSSCVFLFCKIYNEKFVGYCVFRNNNFYSLKIYNQSIKSNPYYLIQLHFSAHDRNVFAVYGLNCASARISIAV
jgi:hypothetical protein